MPLEELHLQQDSMKEWQVENLGEMLSSVEIIMMSVVQTVLSGKQAIYMMVLPLLLIWLSRIVLETALGS